MPKGNTRPDIKKEETTKGVIPGKIKWGPSIKERAIEAWRFLYYNDFITDKEKAIISNRIDRVKK